MLLINLPLNLLEYVTVSPRNLVHWLIGLGLCLSLMSGQAWGHEGAKQHEGGTTIVAAGFGFQNGSESSITVKVYDAATGEVLSEDVYELSIKEDPRTQGHMPEARIFAGGVGQGATDLSNFVLRAYDAKTGAFQWTGQLDLAVNREGEAKHLISTVVPRRAVVTKIHNAVESSVPHPLFVLRAWDTVTGGVMWEDRFSTDPAGAALARQIAAGSAGSEGPALGSDSFDLRILMLDNGGQTVLWEDQVLQQPADEEIQGAVEDRAQMLPAWTESVEEDASPEEI